MTLLDGAELVGQLKLDDLPRLVGEIYGAKDELRSLWDVWLHAHHHAAAVGQAVRGPSIQERVIKETADLTFWLLTIGHRVRGDLGVKRPGEDGRQSIVRVRESLSRLLWNRCPGLCPICYWRVTRSRGSVSDSALPDLCECAAHPGEQPDGANRRRLGLALRSLAQARISQKPESLDQWQKRLGEIYKNYLETVALERVLFELFTQMGEVSDAMVRTYTYKVDRNVNEFVAPEPTWRITRFEDDLGDLFRWLFLVVEKLSLEISGSGSELLKSVTRPLRLSWILWQRYGSPRPGQLYCPFCKHSICNCGHLFILDDASVAELVQKTTEIG